MQSLAPFLFFLSLMLFHPCQAKNSRPAIETHDYQFKKFHLLSLARDKADLNQSLQLLKNAPSEFNVKVRQEGKDRYSFRVKSEKLSVRLIPAAKGRSVFQFKFGKITVEPNTQLSALIRRIQKAQGVAKSSWKPSYLIPEANALVPFLVGFAASFWIGSWAMTDVCRVQRTPGHNLDESRMVKDFLIAPVAYSKECFLSEEINNIECPQRASDPIKISLGDLGAFRIKQDKSKVTSSALTPGNSARRPTPPDSKVTVSVFEQSYLIEDFQKKPTRSWSQKQLRDVALGANIYCASDQEKGAELLRQSLPKRAIPWIDEVVPEEAAQ